MITSSSLLTVCNLSRYYGAQQAVDDVNFQLNKEEIIGLLGPNGAGKTTTMKMLSGQLTPHHGQITIHGYDLITQAKQAKRHIGYLPETPPLYKDLTVQEFLSFCAQIHGVGRQKVKETVALTLERCALTQVKSRLISHLSKGYQQRIGISQATLHNPDIVILDEPTSGLDPIQIKDIRQLIRDIAKDHAVILSTHILSEVNTLCDRVLILDQGKLIFNNSTTLLNQRLQTHHLSICLLSPPPISHIEQLNGVLSVKQEGKNRFNIYFQKQCDPTQALLEKALHHHWQLTALTPQQHSLEEAFLDIIQHDHSHQMDHV